MYTNCQCVFKHNSYYTALASRISMTSHCCFDSERRGEGLNNLSHFLLVVLFTYCIFKYNVLDVSFILRSMTLLPFQRGCGPILYCFVLLIWTKHSLVFDPVLWNYTFLLIFHPLCSGPHPLRWQPGEIDSQYNIRPNCKPNYSNRCDLPWKNCATERSLCIAYDRADTALLW